MNIDWTKVDPLIEWSIEEDVGTGDITTNGVLYEKVPAIGEMIAKDDMVLAGIEIVPRILSKVTEDFEFNANFKDGDHVPDKSTIATIKAEAHILLTHERVILNYVQRLSGIATYASKFASQVEGTKAKIVDTRKTTPGWRVLEKYAVRVGGGKNHRFGLFDAVLIKDNHIKMVGSITEAVSRMRDFVPHYLKLEVEASTPEEVKEALDAGVEIIMLDNMDEETLEEMVKLIDGKATIEVSGGVTLDNVGKIAKLGVDLISIGALTHSAAAEDISMIIKPLDS
ncbi:MAG: carboxylating nicotinate-nucleotide diphosphorylase [Candidatus Schekmanbacteria bacterium]|nr:MAG: carboxylating nicotinate-nucleotide diphosphorylase [Candidatus Schekmanbacteria bacterium]